MSDRGRFPGLVIIDDPVIDRDPEQERAHRAALLRFHVAFTSKGPDDMNQNEPAIRSEHDLQREAALHDHIRHRLEAHDPYIHAPSFEAGYDAGAIAGRTLPKALVDALARLCHYDRRTVVDLIRTFGFLAGHGWSGKTQPPAEPQKQTVVVAIPTFHTDASDAERAVRPYLHDMRVAYKVLDVIPAEPSHG